MSKRSGNDIEDAANELEQAKSREELAAVEEAARQIRAMRGRWLVVFDGGGALRCSSRRRATGYARACRAFGIPARVIRYRRDRVTFDATMPQLEVNDERWLP